jgi:Tol biopolymer transport system component/DNA-binding winged helix-turn-helix (wHTH) protein
MADFRYYKFDDFLLDAEEGVLYREGAPVQLTRKVFDLLLLLVRSGGRVLNHDEIINTLWADTSVEQANLKQSIYVLRRALGELPEENRFIKTLPKRGYRFLCEVRALPDERRALFAERTVTDVFIEEIVEDDTDERPRRELLPPARRGFRIWQTPLFIALLCAIVFSGFGYGVYRFASAGNAAPPPPPVSLENASWQKLTNAGDVHFATLSPNGEFVAYVALNENAQQSIRVLNVGNRSEITVVAPAEVSYWGVSFTPDSSQVYYTVFDRTGESNIARLYAVSIFGGAPRKVLEPINSPMAFTRDGTRLVYARSCADNRKPLCLVVANAADGGDQREIAATEKNEFIAPNFSPDGSRILFTAGDNREDGWYWYLAEIPAAGGERKIITEPRRGRFFGALWFADGKGILLNAVADDSKLQQLWYVSYPDGEITRVTNDLIGYYSHGVSADGRKIVSVEQTRTNSIWTVPFGDSNLAAVSERLTKDTLVIQSMAWTPDNRIVFDSFDNGRTHLWMMNADGSGKRQISPENIEEYRAAVSPDGRFLLFLSNRSGAWQLWRARLDGGEPKQLTFGKDSPRHAKFAGGGKIIFEYFLNNNWRLVQASLDGGEPTPVTDAAPLYWNVSPDGKTIAYSFSDAAQNRTRVAVQALEDKTKVSFLEITPRDFLLFSPDGKSLLTKPPATVADSLSSIFSYPIDGGAAKKIVVNPPENIYWADISADGKRLAWVQGKIVSNVVLLTRWKQ